MKTMMPIVSLLAVALVAGCSTTGTRSNAGGSSSMSGASASSASAADRDMGSAADTRNTSAPNSGAAMAGDGLALAMLAGVNEHEIAAARQAREKKVSAPVLAYADMMDKEHTTNQTKTRTLGTPAMTPEVDAMKAKKASERAALGKMSGKAYETAYVSAMVKDHAEALQLIDSKLLPAATSAPVRAHLTDTRRHVAMHLEQAQKLQAAK